MAIIDHLFLFPDEATAHAVLDPHGFGFPRFNDGESIIPASWDGSRVTPCRVIMGREPVTMQDEAGDWFTWDRDIYMEGFHLNVALPEMRDDLVAMPVCVLVTDRDKAAVEGAIRSDFLLHTKVSEATMDAVLGVTPVPMGSGYPFGLPEVGSA